MSHPRALGEAKLKRIIGWKATSHATSFIIVIIVIIVRRPRMCLAEDVPLVEPWLQFAESSSVTARRGRKRWYCYGLT